MQLFYKNQNYISLFWFYRYSLCLKTSSSLQQHYLASNSNDNAAIRAHHDDVINCSAKTSKI